MINNDVVNNNNNILYHCCCCCQQGEEGEEEGKEKERMIAALPYVTTCYYLTLHEPGRSVGGQGQHNVLHSLINS